ncbi:MAG: dienelactone hydrolase family protein, partial [Hyphomicrobiaceae bacterium]|nr:dienelactone hydrolase family protein [Hyphomicrobiaceae bacterium]
MSNTTRSPRVVDVRIGARALDGQLGLPPAATGLVIFAHGSGSSRTSPRNRAVARALNARGLATLLFDLLAVDEAADRANVFDIELLGDRVVEAAEWARTSPEVSHLRLGLFGASTGAAAALVAAARLGPDIGAVVSRGGRPDLAGSSLARVQCPTLLIVGGADYGVIELNEAAFAKLRCEKRLEVVSGATHLFEEPGAMDRVVELAGAWLEGHLRGSTPKVPSGVNSTWSCPVLIAHDMAASLWSDRVRRKRGTPVSWGARVSGRAPSS